MNIKTLNRLLKLHAGDVFSVPRSVQKTVPITAAWPDGIFQHGQLYSMCWRFSDINYAVANRDDQEVMFLQYSDLLNALDIGASTKFTILNHRFNRQEFERNSLMAESSSQQIYGALQVLPLLTSLGITENVHLLRRCG